MRGGGGSPRVRPDRRRVMSRRRGPGSPRRTAGRWRGEQPESSTSVLLLTRHRRWAWLAAPVAVTGAYRWPPPSKASAHGMSSTAAWSDRHQHQGVRAEEPRVPDDANNVIEIRERNGGSWLPRGQLGPVWQPYMVGIRSLRVVGEAGTPSVRLTAPCRRVT